MAKSQVVGEKEFREKLAKFRAAALQGFDAIFDHERGVFLIAGKHPQLVGTEAVVSLDLISMCAMFGDVLPRAIVPMLAKAAQMTAETAPTKPALVE